MVRNNLKKWMSQTFKNSGVTFKVQTADGKLTLKSQLLKDNRSKMGA